jgi:hypothetical protein
MSNVLVEWETGDTTYEPLDLIAKMIQLHALSADMP